MGSVLTGSTGAADTIVFGGRDASGNYLNEIWLLRAYNGTINQSNQKWSGYGSGQLQSGVHADGTGVTVQYMTSCAKPIGSSPTAGTSPTGSGSSSPTSPNSPSNTGSSGPSGPTTITRFDTSAIHKSLAPVSAALVLPAVVFYRLSQPSVSSPQYTNAKIGFFYLTSLTALVAFALGVGGLATAFSSLQYTTSVVKRSGIPHLTTPHGQAGIALFAGLYGLVPALIAASTLIRWRDRKERLPSKRQRTTSNEFAEKLGLRSSSPFTREVSSPDPQTSERVRSGESLHPWPTGHIPAARRSSESAADDRSSPSTRSFEVTNRPTRARHASAHSLAMFAEPRPSVAPRNLSDMSWMERRRSVNTAVSVLVCAYLYMSASYSSL